MNCGVSKSGSPAPIAMTSRPSALSFAALAETARVGDGLIALRRSAMSIGMERFSGRRAIMRTGIHFTRRRRDTCGFSSGSPRARRSPSRLPPLPEQGNGVWYVMPDGSWVTPTTYAGTLYRTTGSPWMGSAYDAHRLAVSAVGTMRLSIPGGDAGTMAYTVNGV